MNSLEAVFVQLNREDVKAGVRHFTIPKDYTTNFNASNNGYVDATVGGLDGGQLVIAHLVDDVVGHHDVELRVDRSIHIAVVAGVEVGGLSTTIPITAGATMPGAVMTTASMA